MRVRLFVGLVTSLASCALALKAFGTGLPTGARLDPASAYIGAGDNQEVKGNLDRAIAFYTEAIRANPARSDAYFCRAWAYKKKGALTKAIADCSEVIRREPESGYAYLGRAKVYEEIGNLEKARADYNEVIKIVPKDAHEHMARGEAYFAKGNYTLAASDFAYAANFRPVDDYVLGLVAWFRATCPEDSLRNGKEAVQKSMKACQLTKWNDPEHIDTLAGAYAEVGNFDQAIKYQIQAMNMKSVSPSGRREMQEHLAHYRNHKPYRKVSKFGGR